MEKITKCQCRAEKTNRKLPIEICMPGASSEDKDLIMNKIIDGFVLPKCKKCDLPR